MGLRAILLSASLLVAACSGAGEGEARPPIVLITIDTLRADALTGRPDAMPSVAGLAARGVVFEDAVAASPWTGPSMAAVLSGRYPGEIGIRGLRDALPASVETLPERLQDAGYRTGAVLSNGLLGPEYGHGEGYELFHCEPYRSQDPDGTYRPAFTADRVTSRALETLARLEERGGPAFLHVHYTDPHEPYLPPERWRDLALGERPALGEDELLRQAFVGLRATPRLLRGVRAAYDGEVSFVDDEIGRLLEGLPADAVVLLTSDHGEEFQDHGSWLHGHTLYEELLHVPMILVAPDAPPGTRVRGPVSHVDVLPTLCELAGVPAQGPEVSGRSLLARVRDPELAPTPVIAALEGKDRDFLAARHGRWKLHWFPGTGQVSLYDVAADPGERADVASQRPRIVGSLRSVLEAYRARCVPAESASAEEEARRVEALRAIGYVR